MQQKHEDLKLTVITNQKGRQVAPSSPDSAFSQHCLEQELSGSHRKHRGTKQDSVFNNKYDGIKVYRKVLTFQV